MVHPRDIQVNQADVDAIVANGGPPRWWRAGTSLPWVAAAIDVSRGRLTGEYRRSQCADRDKMSAAKQRFHHYIVETYITERTRIKDVACRHLAKVGVTVDRAASDAEVKHIIDCYVEWVDLQVSLYSDEPILHATRRLMLEVNYGLYEYCVNLPPITSATDAVLPGSWT